MTALKVVVAALTTAMFLMVAVVAAVISLIASHLLTFCAVAVLVAVVVAYRRRRCGGPGATGSALAPPATRPAYPVMTYPSARPAVAGYPRALPPRPVR